MTSTGFNRRQRAVEAALEHAGAEPGHVPSPDCVPAVHAAFSSTEQLLTALQHKWTQLLTGRVGFAQADIDDNPVTDKIETVLRAWQDTAADNPVLREVLDRYGTEVAGEELARAFDHERRMLALASGLADHGEPTAEISRAGTALLRLLRVADCPLPDAHQLTAASR